MGIKWAKYTYRIVCSCDGMDERIFTREQLVNGYVCAVDLNDSNRPWPIGIHKNGKLWSLTDLISGLKVQEFAKRPTADDIEVCMPMILKYWRWCIGKAENREFLVYTPEQKAYKALCPFTPQLILVQPVEFCSSWYSYPEFACMRLCRGWIVDNEKEV